MTLVKIEKSDKDRLAKLAAECGLVVNFYTIESNPLLLQAAIHTHNGEILFGLGKMFGYEIMQEIFTK
jgi:hypothetical protein